MLLVIGGHSRNIGKTAIAAAIIRSTRRYRWVAVKISAHRHGGGDGTPFVLAEERSRDGCSDSSRFLAAGAAHSFWLRASDQHLGAAMSTLSALRQLSPNLIVESNRILAHLAPDLYLAVLDYAVDDFKESARRFFGHADAYVVVSRGERTPRWKDVPIERIRRRPTFKVLPGHFGSERLIEFVETAMQGNTYCRDHQPANIRAGEVELTAGCGPR
jgi:hypothetical protein